jgi:hypothetical protein
MVDYIINNNNTYHSYIILKYKITHIAQICTKPWPLFPTAYVLVFYMVSDLNWEVIVWFVDIGDIVDYLF